jgi:two-component system, OmpR family, sensor histidine kinase TctE
MKTLRTDPDRFGIRARLLTLLLPGILGLLALDSWNDYRALRDLVQDAYDQTLLESANILRSSVAVAPDGSLYLNAPAVARTMQEDTGPQHKQLHVGLTPHRTTQDSASPPEELILLGETDLPPLPSALPQAPASVALPSTSSASTATAAHVAAPGVAAAPAPVWYDGYYRGQTVRVVALRNQVTDGHGQAFDLLVQAAESTGPRDRAQAAYLQQELLRDARMVLVMILLVWLGVTWSLQPLERLRKTVLKSKGRDLKPLDTSDVPHEVAPLVEAVNLHVASYRELLDQQSQFLADASHQLRTPLAIMLTQAGVALREKEPAQLRETLRAIVVQISRSRRLCEQLLSLAHASDSTSPHDAPALIDLNMLARDVVLQYLSLAHEKNQDLGWVDAEEELAQDRPQPEEEEGDEEDRDGDSAPAGPPATFAVPVLARGVELYEVLSNLVHNAIVYTPAGGSITVMARLAGGMAQAEVRDDGPGIAAERHAEVFERFHHSGTSPAKSARGAGLGMAIARAYARRNGGDITLEAPATDGGLGAVPGRTGLRAILQLPAATALPA